MEKIYGATSAQNGLYRVGRLKWEVIYGFGKDHQEDETGYNYRLRYSYRPRLENIKKDIVEAINEIVREKGCSSGACWYGSAPRISEIIPTGSLWP